MSPCPGWVPARRTGVEDGAAPFRLVESRCVAKKAPGDWPTRPARIEAGGEHMRPLALDKPPDHDRATTKRNSGRRKNAPRGLTTGTLIEAWGVSPRNTDLSTPFKP